MTFHVCEGNVKVLCNDQVCCSVCSIKVVGQCCCWIECLVVSPFGHALDEAEVIAEEVKAWEGVVVRVKFEEFGVDDGACVEGVK